MPALFPRKRFAMMSLAGLVVLATLANYIFNSGHHDGMFVVALTSCLGFAAAWHLLLLVLPVTVRQVKALDYPYYVLGLLGIFSSFSLNHDLHTANMRNLAQQELVHQLIEMRDDCREASSGAPYAAACKSLLTEIVELRVFEHGGAYERIERSGIFEETALLSAVPKGVGLVAEYQELRHKHAAVDHETLHHKAEATVRFEAWWPLLLSLAFSIKLVKTSAELLLERRKERQAKGETDEDTMPARPCRDGEL